MTEDIITCPHEGCSSQIQTGPDIEVYHRHMAQHNIIDIKHKLLRDRGYSQSDDSLEKVVELLSIYKTSQQICHAHEDGRGINVIKCPVEGCIFQNVFDVDAEAVYSDIKIAMIINRLCSHLIQHQLKDLKKELAWFECPLRFDSRQLKAIVHIFSAHISSVKHRPKLENALKMQQRGATLLHMNKFVINCPLDGCSYSTVHAMDNEQLDSTSERFFSHLANHNLKHVRMRLFSFQCYSEYDDLFESVVVKQKLNPFHISQSTAIRFLSIYNIKHQVDIDLTIQKRQLAIKLKQPAASHSAVRCPIECCSFETSFHEDSLESIVKIFSLHMRKHNPKHLKDALSMFERQVVGGELQFSVENSLSVHIVRRQLKINFESQQRKISIIEKELQRETSQQITTDDVDDDEPFVIIKHKRSGRSIKKVQRIATMENECLANVLGFSDFQKAGFGMKDLQLSALRLYGGDGRGVDTLGSFRGVFNRTYNNVTVCFECTVYVSDDVSGFVLCVFALYYLYYLTFDMVRCC